MKQLNLVLLLIATPAMVAAQENSRPPMIDMHMHANAVNKDADGRPLSRPCLPSPCQVPPAEAETAEDVLRLTLETMDRNNIVIGFLSEDSLDNVYRWVDAAPGRFIASPIVGNPDLIDLDDLPKEYEAGRLGGLGELTVQYEGIAADDPRLEPFYDLAEEFDVQVLIHHHGTAGLSEQFRISMGHPEQLEEVLIRHPELRLFIETSGFPFLGETIALMYRYPNVYGDLSLWKYPREMFHWYLRRLMEAGLGKRLMYGSDQMQWPETIIDDEIDAIESASFLSEEQKRDIFHNNAARVLRLSKETIAKHHGQ